jgi:hypothetical protein
VTVTLSPQLMAQSFDDIKYDHKLTSTFEYDSNDTISIYNTGLSLSATDTNGFSVNLRGSVDGKIDEINSSDFNLGKFVKELDLNYKIDTTDAVILLSVGKMPTGAKLDPNSPKELGGVMGIRLTIKPKNIPLIEEWLKKNDFKINRIDITRYNAESSNDLNIQDLNKANMTSYAIYLSKGYNLQTFFIYKTPDAGNINGVTSKSLGAGYMMDAKYNPQFFAMVHKSDAAFMNLDLLVISAGIEIAPSIRNTYTYSRATETMSKSSDNVYDISFSKEFKKTKSFSLDGTIGVKIDRGTNQDKIYYMRLEARY